MDTHANSKMLVARNTQGMQTRGCKWKSATKQAVRLLASLARGSIHRGTAGIGRWGRDLILRLLTKLGNVGRDIFFSEGSFQVDKRAGTFLCCLACLNHENRPKKYSSSRWDTGTCLPSLAIQSAQQNVSQKKLGQVVGPLPQKVSPENSLEGTIQTCV
jgi:hypothetical protein